ncbi:MAG: TetR/AcrR family transcriptional regulator [Gemmatimonadota bacterium]|nr:TetR/AcrR family transcriptional regulator [Gemmatimonadota bacterium]
MTPRPRTVPDADILAAAYRVMSHVGPTKLTLAAIAREAGLAPATLVQRFGSKRGLLLALSSGAAEFVDECFAAVRAENPSPLDALIAAATFMTQLTTTPEEMANHLAYLQIDISDPDFHRHILDHTRRTIAGYRALLDDAVAAGELAPCDTERLARAVASLTPGSLLTWAIVRDGSSLDWVRADLATLLDPYRAEGARPAPSSARRMTAAKGGRRVAGDGARPRAR